MRDAVRGVAQGAPQSLQASARLSASEPAPTAPAPPKSSVDDAAKTPPHARPKGSGEDAAKTPLPKRLWGKRGEDTPLKSSGEDAAKTPHSKALGKTPLPKSSGENVAKTPHSKTLGETRRRRPSPQSPDTALCLQDPC